MLNTIINGTEITVQAFFICTAASMLLGLGCAAVCMYRSRYSQSFAVTLAILPAVVQLIIMLVNGNIGTGVAVAGAFGLVRFRSAPGSAREISMLFLAMAIGLATGMGYIVVAFLFFLLVALYTLVLLSVHFGERKENERELKITIPENLDYEGLFDDLLNQYAERWELLRVKTTNMGTLYELDYSVLFRDASIPREFLDALRCRNGNLNIVCGRPVVKEAL